jgi:hypothetical protein
MFVPPRTPAPALGDDASTGWRVEVLGDGRRFRLAYVCAGLPDGVVYQAGMTPPAGVWTTLELPRAAFVARFRGRAVPEAPSLRPSLVREIGLLIGDRQAGPFALGLRRNAALLG